MKKIGGKDYRSILYNLVKNCFSAEIQKLCNWTGANKKFRLKKTILAKLILQIAVDAGNVTISDAENHFKYIFQHTYDRLKSKVSEIFLL